MWSVSYRITQLFLLLLVAKLLSFDSLSLSVGKEPKSLLFQVVLVVGDINTLYSRIIIRLLLNMDFKDIPNCFCSKFDLMHVKRKQNKTINAHFPFQLHATIHTHKYTGVKASTRCSVGGRGAGRYYALWVRVLFFSVVACIRIIYCHWRRWVYEPGLKSDVNIIFLTFDIIRYTRTKWS